MVPSPPKVDFYSLTHLLKHAILIDEDQGHSLVLLQDGRLFFGTELPEEGKVLWEEQDFAGPQ